MSILSNVFGIGQEKEEELEKSFGRVRTVTEHASDLADALKDSELGKALVNNLPWWTGPLAEAAGETIPLVKFAIKLLEKLPEKPSAKSLGLLACTLAFQRACEEALREIGQPANKVPMLDAVAETKARAAQLKMSDPDILRGFSLEQPATHPFVFQALELMKRPFQIAGYSSIEIRKLNGSIREHFKIVLRELLSDPSTKDKFSPFVQWAQLGSEEDRAYHSLQAYAERQRMAFMEFPVLGHEPFSLAEVYTETDCGELPWKTIKGDGKHENRVDAFSEENGGRQPLVSTVVKYLEQDSFRDAIVIQGGPGAGKSAFTLRMTDELFRLGLTPIRIRIRDIRIDLPLFEALSRAITDSEDLGIDQYKAPKPKNALLDGRIFDEPANFGNAIISRFVLILDGWDEVSTAEKGYQIQVKELLQNVRNELLRRANPPVRVILTGRPSDAIAASSFLGDNTPILTIRPYTPIQLEGYVTRLAAVLTVKDQSIQDPTNQWEIPNPGQFKNVFKLYAQQFKGGKTPGSSLDVLGQPLLAHLALRVMSEYEQESAIEELVSSPTKLYRSLVDLTCGKAGKAPTDSGDTGEQSRIRGADLRQKLHQTAAAITAWGQESIPFGELALRAGFQESEQDYLSKGASQDRPWTRLMISFYFKGGGEHHGCEFLHKSFREYLFAEGIVSTLKEHARKQQVDVAVRDREKYWQDFQPDDRDQRYSLSRALAELLAPQWLSPEVKLHVENLIPWEIGRASSVASSGPLGECTGALDQTGWERVRDLLAELWDWWAKGFTCAHSQFEIQGQVGLILPLHTRWSS